MFARIGRGPKRNEVTGDWKLHDLCSTPNIILVNKSRKMRWSVHVALIGGGEEKCVQDFGAET